MECKKVLILERKVTDEKFEIWNCFDIDNNQLSSYKFINPSNNYVIYVFCKWNYITRMKNILTNNIPNNNINDIEINISFSTINIKTNANFMTLFGTPHLDEFNSKMYVIECSISNLELTNLMWANLLIAKTIQPFFYILKPFNILMRDILRNIIQINYCVPFDMKQQTMALKQEPTSLITVLPNQITTTTSITPHSLITPTTQSMSKNDHEKKNFDLNSYLPLNIYTIVVNEQKEITGFSPIGTNNNINLELINRLLSRIPIVFIQLIDSHGLNYSTNLDVEIEQIIISIHISFHIILTKKKTLHKNLQLNLLSTTKKDNNYNAKRNVTVIEFDTEFDLLKYFLHIYSRGELFKYHNYAQNFHFFITENYSKFISILIFRIVKNNLWPIASKYVIQSGNFVLLNQNALILTSSLIDINNIHKSFKCLRNIKSIYNMKDLLNDTFLTKKNRDHNMFTTFSLTINDFKNKSEYNKYKETNFCFIEYFINFIINIHETTLAMLISTDGMMTFLHKLNNLKLYLCDVNLITEQKAIELEIFYSYIFNREIFLESHIKNSNGVFIKTLKSNYKSLESHLSYIKQQITLQNNNDINNVDFGPLVPTLESLCTLSKILNIKQYVFTKNFNTYSKNSLKVNIEIENIYKAIINKYRVSLNNQCIVLGIELICMLYEIRKVCVDNCIIFCLSTMLCKEDYNKKLDLNDISLNELYIIIIPWLNDVNYFNNIINTKFNNIIEYFSNEDALYSNVSFYYVITSIYNKYMCFLHAHFFDIINNPIINIKQLQNFEYIFNIQQQQNQKINNDVLEIHNGHFLIEILLNKYSNNIFKKLQENLRLYFNNYPININIIYKSKFALKYTSQVNDIIYYDELKHIFKTSQGGIVTECNEYLKKIYNGKEAPNLSDFNNFYFSTVLWYLYKMKAYRRKIQQSDRNYILNTTFIIPSHDQQQHQLNINVLNVFFSIFFKYEDQLLKCSIDNVNNEDKACLLLFYKQMK